MIVQDIVEAYKHKNSKVAVFLGSGSSINDITSDEWKSIQECDIWTVNNWVYHPKIVPDFYHLELKHYGYPIIKRRMAEKKDQYKNVKFIFPKDKYLKIDGLSVLTMSALPEEHRFVFTYDWCNRLTTEKININADYDINSKTVSRSYGTSFSSVLELMYKFGYKKIVLFGVDLKDSYYFWTGGDPKYGEVHHQTNKAHENKNPKLPHNTIRIMHFIIDFNKKWMLPQNKEIVVGYKSTILYPDLDYFDIRSLEL